MIAKDSRSYPCLAWAQHNGEDYGTVLRFVEARRKFERRELLAGHENNAVADFVKRHPDYADILDHFRQMGVQGLGVGRS